MNHIELIQKEMQWDAILLMSEANCFYATSFQGEGACLITKNEAFYFTDSRYTEAATTAIRNAKVLEFSGKQPLLKMLSPMLVTRKIDILAIEDGYISLSQMKHIKDELSVSFAEGSALLQRLRASKDADEVSAMIQAQRIAEKTLTSVLQQIEPGMTERQLSARIQYELLLNGATKMSFDPIVACGPNTSMPHAVPTDRVIQKGDFVTMDFGCIYNGYCSDMTRTVAVGSASEEMKQVYSVVLEAQLAGIAKAAAGIKGKEIDAAARNVIEKANYGQYFGHSFGHSLGIEIHESPNASPKEETQLPLGAVISAEPGIYLPGQFGVRIEDVIVLKEKDCQVITMAPKELLIL